MDEQSGNSPHYPATEWARLMSGGLPPRRRKRLQKHLSTCAQCQQQWREIAAVRGLLQRAPAVPVPRSFALTAQDMPARRPILLYPLLRAATAAVATLVLIVYLGGPLPAGRLEITPGREPLAENTPTPLPQAVGPASTARPKPTWAATAGVTPLLPTVGISGGLSYPGPTAVESQIEATASPPETTAPEEPAASAHPETPWYALQLGGLSLLGVLAGLTYLAYRREKAFFI